MTSNTSLQEKETNQRMFSPNRTDSEVLNNQVRIVNSACLPLSSSGIENAAFANPEKSKSSTTSFDAIVNSCLTELKHLFRLNKGEVFEDGMETRFASELVAYVYKYGNHAVEALTYLIIYDNTISAQVASEALRWLGNMEHPESYKFRLWLLERCLSHPSLYIRDGAIVGLSFLNDPHSMTYLEKAMKIEQLPGLVNDIKQVLAQLTRRK